MSCTRATPRSTPKRGCADSREHVHPYGVFALWSDDPPDDEFRSVLAAVFASTQAHVVSFPNPLTGEESANTVYVASTAS